LDYIKTVRLILKLSQVNMKGGADL
jgi:hypothetical protein